ncbi:hypothetical protein EXM63_02545 [Clostridium botulinum]|uniref:Uncharacterized protein n=1 Tax=Clostridium botulinum TaxID=1491 RepID=A0A6M0SXT5_CLOBO|nr:hypothetical protein [Clostridium botulinum]NFI74330.1 hypothetical protein [Clostridium sporogenes]NFP62238.1 hypothetical protein [Clostridium sporogenes]NFU95610.1 hypothetical protein [Clostridium sporogenes]NFV67943.1 hypothetical protein [Clostridium botulinum]
MEKPKYQNYRVCYENGNKVTGKEIYELYKYCDCQSCKNRATLKREPANRATATTKDISKVDEVAEFLKNWTCEDEKRNLEIAYFQF